MLKTIPNPLELLRCSLLLLRHKGLRKVLILPWLTGIATLIILLFSSIGFGEPLLAELLGKEPGFWWKLLFYPLLVLVEVLVSIFATIITSELLFEFFVSESLQLCGFPQFENEKSLMASSFKIIIEVGVRVSILAMLLVLNVIALFSPVPFLNVVLFVLSSFYLSGDMLSTTLSSLEASPRTQIKLILRHPFETLFFGCMMTALLLIPFAGILAIPSGYLMAMRKVARWSRQPTWPQGLPRAV